MVGSVAQPIEGSAFVVNLFINGNASRQLTLFGGVDQVDETVRQRERRKRQGPDVVHSSLIAFESAEAIVRAAQLRSDAENVVNPLIRSIVIATMKLAAQLGAAHSSSISSNPRKLSSRSRASEA